MPQLRKCARCGAPSLTPVSRELQIYNSVIHYKCEECGTEIELTPPASIGTVTTAGLFALGFWGFLLFTDPFPPGWIALTLYGLAILALGFVTLRPALDHFRNPVIDASPTADLSVEGPDNHIARKPILLLEGFGFLAGLLAPVLLFAGVLAIASVIGFINFTYFGN
ncbi:hypothetical protein [Cohaesibacter gelatinilyticus]|uniref:Uncharacterized protein n=1 Tax=Cohaesibacter gelatinilyticus TaxID=372072 RepID=A0A285PLS0_9HYPH|nr:hypothetical protein [Cohaesibacter gelatinilyticus]SNZ21066.1 hypothetical protein SAMN06265368_4180 [Cohaesibacter gelatinilyticus]HAT87233.1 hypothetical protein [Hyphomicrobiales bacterium]